MAGGQELTELESSLGGTEQALGGSRVIDRALTDRSHTD